MIIKDWQTEVDDSKQFEIETDDVSIHVAFLSGERIWIELENGVIRVHGYGPTDDEPQNMELTDVADHL